MAALRKTVDTPLRFSVPDWCMKKGTANTPEYYSRLQALGVTGVEMVDPACSGAAREAGLEILNIVGKGMEKGFNRVENHAELTADIRGAIKTTAEAKIPQVIVFSGNRGGQLNEEGIANCAKALKPLAVEAKAAGVMLVFEMLNSFDHKDYQADSAEYGFKLSRAINEPAFKLVYDVYHMARMGRSAEAMAKDIAEHVREIAHVHVAGSPRRDFPGPEQETDYRVIVKALLKAKYKGYIGLEFVPKEPLEEVGRAVTLFGRYAS